ncbi:hypothetical protein L1987_02034 [Smallanthus sonchifolius]|uniref:Uncharacterized protein n=1 Tax=Smallanthus sonchifolius TaxID=185202 RepID=A0ACB9K6X8_9ASTR|nr:hypothetical protein L1987_02034 [Smallanthus sonchifolius]
MVSLGSKKEPDGLISDPQVVRGDNARWRGCPTTEDRDGEKPKAVTGEYGYGVGPMVHEDGDGPGGDVVDGRGQRWLPWWCATRTVESGDGFIGTRNHDDDEGNHGGGIDEGCCGGSCGGSPRRQGAEGDESVSRVGFSAWWWARTTAAVGSVRVLPR